ncbi:aryl hydrocarbon receptor-like isoform X1 [Cynoglossus semilaevis]|uniref:aryl hydrocarbon receptor-like isoform X1 n=1 Tax=Cynoglossus semilaevis TaxID=244447 RepID=UPI0007DCA98D|nr:aryl hydrocarbon receptor-like isoform X1 [Cynoglossus semilaevis]
MLGNQGTYATKKRKKPALKPKKISESNEVVKSNPSKRHRDRLNLELDRLTDLLPFTNDVRSRLDKLSVLRLSVGYLRVKSYLKASTKTNGNSLTFPAPNGKNGQNGMNMDTAEFSEGDLLLQALNGFVIVITSDGLVFYASTTIKDYLGFHQSDVVHQSVFDLIHTDDRDLFREQLHFAMNPSPAGAGGNGLQGTTMLYNPEHLPPENSSFLERSFMCRFRCLLDNSSGFLTLKFQGRLKYLYGQKDNQSNKFQLALFAIAIPIQPPLIVEIRAKMLLFQTRHKLDFTPTGIDSRGMVVLGYSEIEISMKGSGYQFIHAADMMHCATNHMRMIKTGETGLTVFRLLSKSNKWVWVKSNAKLIYKGGRPEFIIAYQKAIENTEGEEYLRQRKMEIPFSLSTGEGVLYNTGPTVDLSVYQFNKKFSTEGMSKDVSPGSLVDCFLKQDEEVYSESLEPPPTVDQVFSESRALVTVQNDPWQEGGVVNPTGTNMVVKKEAKQSVMAVIDNLERLVQSGDFYGALQNMDVSSDELREWESALKGLGHDEDQQNKVKSDLDSMLTNDIFDYIDSILLQEKGGDSVNSINRPNLFPPVPSELCGSGLFKTQSPNHGFSPKNGLYIHQENPVPTIMETSPIVNGTQKLTHQGPLPKHANDNLPQLQELQLQDIFSPSIEIPEIVPCAVNGDSLAPLQSCAQGAYSHIECPQGISGQTQSKQCTVWPQNGLKSPQISMNGHMPQSSVQPPNHMAPGMLDILPPLIPCKDLSISPAPNITLPFGAPCPQQMSSVDTHKIQQWPQGKQQKLPCNGALQTGHAPMPVCDGQSLQSQTFPQNSPWQSSSMSHIQQGGMACGQAATEGNCIFNQHFSSTPAGADMLALSGSSILREPETPLSHSALQGLHCFQWRQVESTLSTSAITLDNVNVFSATEQALKVQQFKENHQQTQVNEFILKYSGTSSYEDNPFQDRARISNHFFP